MIVQDHTHHKKSRFKNWPFALLAISCLLLLVALIRYDSSAQWEPPTDLAEVSCSAEQLDGSQFVSNGHRFSGGQYQSDAAARSGQYSCRLPPRGETVYGLGYRWENVRPGTAYRATIWRKRGATPMGYLVVSADGDNGFYQQTSTAVVRDSTGWEQLELRFAIPYQDPPASFSVYVYSQGEGEVFFDDFAVRRLSEPDGDTTFRPRALFLEVPPSGMEQLQAKREQALRRGILESTPDDWVKATLREEGTTALPAELRLKGDWLDHLRGNKWSFRVKVKEGGAWRRLRSFSLHTPPARYFLSEWLLHQLWQQEDVLTTRYDFIEVYLNGKPLGIYAYEEHFDKQIVEYRQRREGPILKLSETQYWQAIQRQLSHHGFVAPLLEPLEAMHWPSAEVDAFGKGKIADSPTLSAQYEQAQSLLRQYMAGQAPASQVFDLQRTARYYAICDIMNAYHGIIWHNQRFYFNPVTALLEPIGFDGFGGRPERRYALLGSGALHPDQEASDHFHTALFLDTAFVRHYVQALHRISQDDYLTPFFDSLYAPWKAREAFLQKEFPTYQPDLNDIRVEAQYVRSLLLPLPGGQVSAQQTQNNPRLLQISNRHPLPVEVVGYGYSPQRPDHTLDSPLLLPGRQARLLYGRLVRDSLVQDFGKIGFLEQQAIHRQAPVLYRPVELPARAKYLFVRTLGTDSLVRATIAPPSSDAAPIPAQRIRAQARIQPDGPYQVRGRELVFAAGRHLIAENIVFPAGYTVVLEAGTQLVLQRGVQLISFSPVQAYGTAEAPIRISAEQGAGGLTILQAPHKSTLKNVVLDGLNTLAIEGWQLTGAVTFYESPVDFYRCSFLNAPSEDALNLIRSTFTLRECRIAHAASDGLDSDFSKGTIEHCRVEQTVNDGLDFSGSVVNIKECQFTQHGDKGISAGEESDLSVFNTQISRANIAIASKDLSTVWCRNLTLRDCEQGLVAFQKKPEFGPGKVVVDGYQAENVGRLQAAGPGSVVQLGE